MSIIAQLHQAINNGKTLAEAIDTIVPGADLAYWQKRLANYDPNAKPAKRKRSRSRSRKATRNFRASAVLARMTVTETEQRIGNAMAEQVTRVNNQMMAVA